jgi:CheY-like chemotaxis protein
VGNELQIIVIEDDLADAARITHELKRRGVSFHSRCVETREDFLSCVERQRPDIILSDHKLRSFNGFDALELAQERCPQVPFVFVTGSYDQNVIVEMFDAGASGCVFKNRMSDLVPVIEQALDELRQRARRLEAAAHRSSAPPPRAGPRTESTPSKGVKPVCAGCKSVRDNSGEWQPLEIYLRIHRQATVTLALCPSCA